MLRFILGKSGSGKTTYIYDRISELVNNSDSKIVMLIPDQSSFETEKIFLNLFGAKKAKQVSVFGFTKLCSYVFNKVNFKPVNVIDNGTRAVIMNLALEQLTEKLNLFSSKNSKSIADVMLKTLEDCKNNNVSTDLLRECSLKINDNTLSSKLYETSLILDTYDALVSQSYIDPLDDLTRLKNILLDNNVFENYILFVDSFSGFNNQQLDVLRMLIMQCKDTFISLTLDPLRKGNDELFETSYNTMRQITDIGNRDFIDIKKPVELNECMRFKNKELAVLEQGICRYDFEKVDTTPENIKLYPANDIHNECEFVAREIKRLVIDNGYLYSDITVIAHDTSDYNGVLNSVFDKYEIPYFMDIPSDIEVKSVIRFVNSLFRMVIDDFERDDVITLLKTGLTANTFDEISVFENYIYVWNLTSAGIKKEFTQNPRGFADSMTDSDVRTLETAERVRKSVVEPALKFKANCKDKNATDITRLLYDLMTEIGVQKALDSMYDTLEKNVEKGLGAEQIRVWNMLMEVLDKMVAILSDKPISIKRYFELLSIQISSMQLSEIPQTLDSVTVTTAQRVRLSKQKATFLIGCIDGKFPEAPKSTGVFSMHELKILALNDIALADDFADFSKLETFMAYCCMTSSSDKLYLSYPQSNLKGEQFTPSLIIEETVKIFTKLKALDSGDVNSTENSMWALQPAFEEYARCCGSGLNISSLNDVFAENEEYKSRIFALYRALDHSPFKIENSDNTHNLFGNDLKISASQIEKFNLCRFSYFCNYGLRVRERKKAEINPLEYGTLVHFILEKFFNSYTKVGYSDCSKEEIIDFVNKILEEYTEDYFGGSEDKTKSFLFKLSTLKENVVLLLCHIVEELSQSDFDVVDCELSIGNDIPAYTLTLPTGQNIAIYGSIDRVDIMEQNGVRYLRVVDYKTGTKNFKLSDVLYGLNLQMLLYLYSVQKNGKDRYGDTTPAGILYMPATVPLISADNTMTDDKIDTKLNAELRMNGLLLNDITVIKGMDRTEKAKYIPVKIKADMPDSKTSLASLEEFGKVFNKLDLIVAQMGADLYSGNIIASPIKDKKAANAYDACTYCPYDSVCTYHMSEPRIVYEFDNKAVFEQLDKESEKGEEADGKTMD
ncbi:MAG: PD-(D/E)XK nuclease family protein [Ruminococcus sp.]|nr:PD-(D/E)XK nuclease family protein [Ruminococcus sp.]